MKIPNKQALQQIAINYSPDTDYDDFKRLERKYTADPKRPLTQEQRIIG